MHNKRFRRLLRRRLVRIALAFLSIQDDDDDDPDQKMKFEDNTEIRFIHHAATHMCRPYSAGEDMVTLPDRLFYYAFLHDEHYDIQRWSPTTRNIGIYQPSVSTFLKLFDYVLRVYCQNDESVVCLIASNEIVVSLEGYNKRILRSVFPKPFLNLL
jgi:hypothetical protein